MRLLFSSPILLPQNPKDRHIMQIKLSSRIPCLPLDIGNHNKTIEEELARKHNELDGHKTTDASAARHKAQLNSTPIDSKPNSL